MLRILFTGGGTGGHIYPILAVVEELQKIAVGKKIEMRLRYFGAPGIFQKLLQENGIKVSRIISAKLRRYFDLRNFIDIPILFPLSVIQSLWKVFWYMPDVLFSKGGPGSLPVVLACRFYRVPIIIHDSDGIPGLANRLAAKSAKRIGISFESAAEFFPKKTMDKIALIGNPVRQSLIGGDILERETAKKIFGFSPEKPVILVMGGSQGAKPINDFMLEIFQDLIKDYQILHQAGVKNFNNVKEELKIVLKNYPPEQKNKYKLVSYFEKDLKDAYAAADLIISRASSGIIFEISSFGRPAILIPLPLDVVGGHQIKNAYEYAKNGAAVVVEQTNLTPNVFIAQIKKIFSDPEKLKQMSQAAKNFSKPEAARITTEEIIRLTVRN